MCKPRFATYNNNQKYTLLFNKNNNQIKQKICNSSWQSTRNLNKNNNNNYRKMEIASLSQISDCHFYQSGVWKFDIFGNTKNKKLSFLSERSVKIWYYWEHEEQKIVIFIRAECENLILLGIRRRINCQFYQSGERTFHIIGNTRNIELSLLWQQGVKIWY